MQNESVVSSYPDSFTVFQLERINRVTGQEFPIGGDAKLRMKFKMLTRLQQKVLLNENYGKMCK